MTPWQAAVDAGMISPDKMIGTAPPTWHFVILTGLCVIVIWVLLRLHADGEPA